MKRTFCQLPESFVHANVLYGGDAYVFGPDSARKFAPLRGFHPMFIFQVNLGAW